MTQARTLQGTEISSQKYDILTALGSHALGGDASTQRLILRFITLITARYNWRAGVLRVGQREIAQLWSVDERTVKREMAKLRALGWLRLESPARRGRVSSYALDMTAIRAATRSTWARVGPDFEARMSGCLPQIESATIVHFPRIEQETAIGNGTGQGLWPRLLAPLRAEMPAVCANWFEPLREAERVGECLTLMAPNAFHANYVRTHYGQHLRDALRLHGGVKTPDIRFIAASE